MFTSDDVRRLAALARLELTPHEMDAFARQLGDILEFARQVQAADTSALADAADPHSIPGTILPPLPAMRDDEVRPSLPRETALANAPDADRHTGLFKVPRVLIG